MRRLVLAILTATAVLSAALGPAVPARAAPPANDDFAGAAPISGAQGRVAVDHDEATLQPGEPEYRTSDSYRSPHRSVWFRWTAPADGWYRFHLDGVAADDCIGTSPVFTGSTISSLVQRSHHSATDIWEATDFAFVRAAKDRTYRISAASNCYHFGYELDLVWEQRAPLIVQVERPDGSPARGVLVEECQADSPAGECWDGDFFGTTDAAGRVYFERHRDGAWTFELDPRSVNLAPRLAGATVPSDTTRAVLVRRSLRALPSVDLDRDGIGDVVSGVPSADRGAVNAGAVVVTFGSGRRLVLDEASAGLPSQRARGEQFGAAVVTADVDRDGWPDLTIGAPGEMVGGVRSGAAFIVFGSSRGIGNGKPALRFAQGYAGVAGSGRAGDRFGAAVAPSLHTTYTHFVVGVPGKDSSGEANAGAVVRFTRFPRSNADLPRSRMWHQDTRGVGGSNVAGDRFGSALAHGGFETKTQSGFSAPYQSLAIGVPGKDAIGAANAGAIVVLRATNRAANYAESGNPLINQNDTGVVPGNGARAGSGFGSSLVAFRAQVPLERFARDRLAVGAPGDGGGSVTVLSSAEAQPQVFASASDNTRLIQGAADVPGANEAVDRFGSALAVGDVNDDGEPDLVVGAPGEEISGRAAAGTVTVLYGARGSSRPGRWIAGGGVPVRPGSGGVPGALPAGARFGTSVAALDVNGSGYPDVVGGAPGSDATARNGGAVYAAHRVRSGLRGGRVVLWPDARPHDGFGARLAAPQFFFSEQ